MGTKDDLDEGTKHIMINVKIHKENKDNLVKYDGFIVSKGINLTYIAFCFNQSRPCLCQKLFPDYKKTSKHSLKYFNQTN